MTLFLRIIIPGSWCSIISDLGFIWTTARQGLLLLCLGALFLFSSCTSSGGGTAGPLPSTKDTTPPVVSSTSPDAQDYSAAIGNVVSATLSELVDCASVTASSFTLQDTTYSKTVGGSVTCSGSTLTFTTAKPLSAANQYTAAITTGVTDLAGNHLAAPYTWSFTTVRINSNLFPTLDIYYTFLTSVPPAPAASYSAKTVAIGDVNGDGLNDVVLATGRNLYGVDYRIFVLLQNPLTGALGWPVSYPAGNGNSVEIGDVNGDGLNDVVVTAMDGIGVFLQNATGGLEPMVFYPSSAIGGAENTYQVRIGDFNNDGRMDVAAIDYGGSSIDIFYQNNTGSLDPAVTYAVSHGGDLDIGDLNGDGLTDIAVSGGAVLLQKPDGTLAAPFYYDLPGDIAVGDLNGDSLADLVGFDTGLSVLLQNAGGGLDAPVWYAKARESPSAVEIADVNQDGRKDVLVVHDGWMCLGVYLQADDGTLLPAEWYGLPYASYAPHALAVGDINNDGRNDVVIADYNSGLVILYHQ